MAHIDNRRFFGQSGPIFLLLIWFLIEIKFIRYYIEMSTSEIESRVLQSLKMRFKLKTGTYFLIFLVNSWLFSINLFSLDLLTVFFNQKSVNMATSP